MINFPKKIIKKAFNLIGLDITRKSINPFDTFLGLKNLPIKTIINVGANEGQFARYLFNLFPEAQIYCFEPIPEPYEKLRQWAEKQRKGKVTTFNFALGDKDGTFEMFSHTEFSPSSSFLKTTDINDRYYPFTKKKVLIPVKLTTLNNWIKTLPKLPATEILIKLDVQGYEDRVINGGFEIFKKMVKACILEICLDRLYEDQADFNSLCSLLYNLGYHYAGNLNQAYADDGHVISIDAVFVK